MKIYCTLQPYLWTSVYFALKMSAETATECLLEQREVAKHYEEEDDLSVATIKISNVHQGSVSLPLQWWFVPLRIALSEKIFLCVVQAWRTGDVILLTLSLATCACVAEDLRGKTEEIMCAKGLLQLLLWLPETCFVAFLMLVGAFPYFRSRREL